MTTVPVSVLIPCYNRGDRVGRAVTSALRQRPAPAEVIVVDDGSSDDSAAVATRAGARVVRRPNGGPGPARNAGLQAAAHEWVALLDSDDEWFPDHLRRMWERRAGHVLLTAVAIGDRSGRTHGNRTRRVRRLTRPDAVFWPENPVATSTVLMSRSAALRVGGFPDRRCAEDLELWARLLEVGPGLALPHIGSLYHEHDGQTSSTPGAMDAAVRAVLRDSRERPWYSRRLEHRVESRLRWDELRQALRDGDWTAAARHAGRLARRPDTVVHLARLWAWRAVARAVTPR